MGKKLLPVMGTVVELGTTAVKTAADFDSAMGQEAAVFGAGESIWKRCGINPVRWVPKRSSLLRRRQRP